MKLWITLILPLFLSGIANADFTMAYAEKAFADYSEAKSHALLLKEAIDQFLKETTQANLENAKTVWTEARKAYSSTEIYRFYGGPIDGEDGPEGHINAWPLDEAYIDYVKGGAKSGIINRTQDFPLITKELLIELNEKDGEKNISTGWHAIEFLLWGQDFYDDSAGQRPLSDYIIGQGPNADRRRAYLSIVTDLLVEQIESVVDAWDKNMPNSFFYQWSQLKETETLTKAFTSLTSMAGDELAIERMFVAYDTQFQEDEHSCFSDTTHFDLLFNFLGIRNLWLLVRDNTSLTQTNPNLVNKIDAALIRLETDFRLFKPPFDQAIFEPEGRDQIINLVNGLQAVSEDFAAAGKDLGLTL